MRREVPTCLVASRLLSSLGTLASPASRVRSYLGVQRSPLVPWSATPGWREGRSNSVYFPHIKTQYPHI